MSKIRELFGRATTTGSIDWHAESSRQNCPFLGRKCIKIRKSQPAISIGTCVVSHGKDSTPIVICPHRILERGQIFTDCLFLLTTHEPGNELHIVPEISIPGGNVDYFLTSVRNQKVMDFVGIELQTLDTTGTVWPERQRFLRDAGLHLDDPAVESSRKYGINWKMNAKTILVQLHHKIETFENLNKHLVLVIQDCLLEYMKREFRFEHFRQAVLGDSMHIHSYRMDEQDDMTLRIELDSRLSTDANGIAACLGLQAGARVELEEIIGRLEGKISRDTLFSFS